MPPANTSTRNSDEEVKKKVEFEATASWNGECPKCDKYIELDFDGDRNWDFDWEDEIECEECGTVFIAYFRRDYSAP